MSSTPSPVPPAPAEAPQAKLGALARLTGVLFNPKETFTDIARVPSWLAALIFLTITGLAVSAVLAQRVDWKEVSRKQIEKSKFAAAQLERLPEAQRERAFDQAAARGKVMRYVRGCIGSVALIFIMGGIYLAAFKIGGLGAALKFKTARAIVAFAYVPLGIKELLGIPIVLLKDPSAIDPENFIASNLAALLPGDAPLWHMALGASVDLFTFWCMALLVVGFSAFNPKKMPIGKAFGVVIAVYAIFVAFGLGMAVIFG
jgi:hypothetical protein